MRLHRRTMVAAAALVLGGCSSDSPPTAPDQLGTTLPGQVYRVEITQEDSRGWPPIIHRSTELGRGGRDAIDFVFKHNSDVGCQITFDKILPDIEYARGGRTVRRPLPAVSGSVWINYKVMCTVSHYSGLITSRGYINIY